VCGYWTQSSWNFVLSATDSLPLRRCGRSGLLFPVISLGLAQYFGGQRLSSIARRIFERALGVGITHFDIANNYGLPRGSAESNFGRLIAKEFRSYRDQIVVSTKAGYQAWEGPYGGGGSRKHLLASLDKSLKRLKLDYIDIFYSHCVDADTPLEETMEALRDAVVRGKARYVGISSYPVTRTLESLSIAKKNGIPLIVHQPSYSIFNRWIEKGLLAALADGGLGCIVFASLAQGLLTDAQPPFVKNERQKIRSRRPVAAGYVESAKRLNDIAKRRGQTLAQMALAWSLRDARVTSSVVGVRNVAQLDELIGCIKNLEFSPTELAMINDQTPTRDINFWQEPYRFSRVSGI
jgi:L-glyceraldehyde 3-phosphate reductase